MKNVVEEQRPLSSAEIAVLESQGCCAEDWSLVTVATAFEPAFVRDVMFSGTIRLGAFQKTFVFDGVPFHSGVYRARLHNVSVADDSLISEVQECLSGYDIAEEAVVMHVGRVVVTGSSSFGNGLKVSALNEAGGREVMIYDHLSAQEAYCMALYRYRPEWILSLTQIIEGYVATVTSKRGTIGKGAVLCGTQEVVNVRIGAYAEVRNAASLVNGSIVSSEADPVHVGTGVIAHNFIVGRGSHVEGAVRLERCYVGEACTLANGFSAVDSLFFSNSHFENGEACALLAGPYSVSHHKSTLMIAAMTSFMNAGSNSNQSNHSYKLGPNKQGILDRGTKLGSGSYIFWPLRTGCFTVVMGHSMVHADLSDLPFSYVIGEGQRVVVVPAVSLRSIGTQRDADKWPKRDHRPADHPLDVIHFEMLNPYTMGQVERGAEKLAELRQFVEVQDLKECAFNGCVIAAKDIRKGLQLYDAIMDYYLLGALARRMEAGASLTWTTDGTGNWCDVAGAIVPYEDMLNPHVLAHIRDDQSQKEWNWVASRMNKLFMIDPAEASPQQLSELLREWADSCRKWLDIWKADAKKEFSESARIGYGRDAYENAHLAACDDFEAVHGTLDDNAFIAQLEKRFAQQYNALESVIIK